MAPLSCRVTFVVAACLTVVMLPAAASDAAQRFLSAHCTDCHDGETKKGGLALTALKFELKDKTAFATWVKVFDKVHAGEMPPKSEEPPSADARAAFLQSLLKPLTAADRERIETEGRATRRRMNRHEYEDTLRDLLSLPNLHVKDFLPEDGEAHHFNKVGDALDVSHVNMARYLNAADFALRQALAPQAERPQPTTMRYYAREQSQIAGKFKVGGPLVRRTFPVLGTTGQPQVISGKAPVTVGAANPAVREQEAVGIAVSSYEPTELRFNSFTAPISGQYKVRVSAYTLWVGNSGPEKTWQPDFSKVAAGRRSEPVTLYSDTPPRLLRKLGSFDVDPEPKVNELTVWLLAGETIRPDAARFFRSRPPDHKNPLAEADGMPAVAFQWLEVEGPLIAAWPPAGHRALFGDLPFSKSPDRTRTVDVASDNPERDAEMLLTAFMARAYRGQSASNDHAAFMTVIKKALQAGHGFTESMLAGYAAVLCSPRFLYLDEAPGKLNDAALAARLAYFLWNAAPDDELLRLAQAGELHKPDVLRAQTERLLNDPKSRRFVDGFVNYWLDLRKIAATAPDATLYPDYQLDDLLVESMIDETQLYFAELVKGDLGARHLVASDFAMLNERLATHYGIEGVAGVALRKVPLPKDSVRGGLMTQASVLKVTANGTTTSPVLRGAWIMERILGLKPPPPPPSVPAVEPDTRGAVTIREQLDKHRSIQSCANCHTKIDPAGFALESFDPMGALRDRYRALTGKNIVKGFGHNGLIFAFSMGLPVDSSGELPGGQKFKDVRELKALLLQDEAQLARNVVHQLAVYATGAAIQFSDRPEVEKILAASKNGGYGIRALIHALVQSELFRHK